MIHVIITTANISEYYENRKKQYIESIESCLKYEHLFDSYTVLECVSDNEEYLNNYNIHYSTADNLYLNKGLNEMTHLSSYLKQSNLKDTDSIIKLSGRYIIEDSYFFEKVLEFNQEYESIFKNDGDVYEGYGYHTFFYYMKKRLFLNTINSLEFSLKNERPIEWDVKSFLMVNETNIEIDRLGLLAFQGVSSDKIFRC